MKFYEYLAAGLPVVSDAIGFRERIALGLEVGGDVEAFVSHRDAASTRKLTVEQARVAVGDNTWQRRLDKMLAITLTLATGTTPESGLAGCGCMTARKIALDEVLAVAAQVRNEGSPHLSHLFP